MKIILGFLICFYSIQGFGKILCHYDGDEFIVYQGEKTYKTDVDNDSINSCISRDYLAAFYDGDEFYIFDSKRLRFVNIDVDNVKQHQTAINNESVAIYDGDELYIYDASNGQKKNVDVDNVTSVGLISNSQVIALYDGDEFYVYLTGRGIVLNEDIDNVNQNFILSASQKIIFIYDQDEIYYSCNEKIYNVDVTNNAQIDIASDILEYSDFHFYSGNKVFIIDSTSCKYSSLNPIQ